MNKEIPGLISFRMDWFDPLAVQGTLNSLLQHHNSKASILQRSAFFMVQLSHPYITTGKTIALTRWTFDGKVMFLLFNMLSRLVPWWLRRLSVCLQCGRPWFDSWVGKIPWRRKWQPTPVFLLGKSHGQRSLVGCNPWGLKESGTTEHLTLT